MMAAAGEVIVPIRVKVRGLWRVVLLGWAIHLFRLGPEHIRVEVKT